MSAAAPRMESAEYPKLAAVEDRMWYFRALHGHLLRELDLGLGPSAEVLDAGCGTGGLIRRLTRVRPGWRWSAVDRSSLALELARARCPDAVEWAQASVEALPFADGAFDAVVSADVLYHVDDDAAALREFFRVLRPGGSVVLNVPAYPWLWSYHDEAVHSRRRYGRGEVLAKLAAAGLVRARATHWNALPLPLIVLRRKLLPAGRGGSDVRLHPAPVEAAFRAAMAAEASWITRMGRLPVGCSILAAAVKPA